MKAINTNKIKYPKLYCSPETNKIDTNRETATAVISNNGIKIYLALRDGERKLFRHIFILLFALLMIFS